MAYSRAAARYAKSFLQLANEKGLLEDAVKDMQMINETCVASKDLIQLLESPIVKTYKKLSILEAIFKSNVSEFTFSFIKLVTEKKREGVIDDIAAAFADLYLEHQNILKAVIKSVNGVDDVILAKVREMVKAAYNKEVQIEEIKDESLIGGFVLTIGDNQIDASISRRLAELRKEFSVNQYVKEI
jgi:F-type H+-transporting ATPase subunit delta